MKKFGTLLIIFLSFLSAAAAQELITVYDGRNSLPEDAQKEKEKKYWESYLQKSVISKLSKKFKNQNCDADFKVNDIVEGSFTAKDLKQTAITYTYCVTGNGFAIDGIVIAENKKIITQFAYEGAWGGQMEKLSDINDNGLDEIVIVQSGGIHQGFYGSGIDILEVIQTRVTNYGSTIVSTNECSEAESAAMKPKEKPASDDDDNFVEPPICPKEIVILAEKAAQPIFYGVTYIEEDENKFVRKGSRKPLKLEKSNIRYYKIL